MFRLLTLLLLLSSQALALLSSQAMAAGKTPAQILTEINSGIVTNSYGNISAPVLQRILGDIATSYVATTAPNTWNSLQTFTYPFILAPVSVASLPTCNLAAQGSQATVNDGTAGLAWGAIATGGFSTPYQVWCNGTNWTVVGK